MTPTRPNYSTDPRHEAMRYVLDIRRFARTAGIRNAATALLRQGLPLALALQVLLRNPLRATHLLLDHWSREQTLPVDNNLGDC